jgi:hypothetical protein
MNMMALYIICVPNIIMILNLLLKPLFYILTPLICFSYGLTMNHLCPIDQISIEELDIIYKIPHCVPISAHHKWNFDDLLEKMWEYLQLVRMYVRVYSSSGLLVMYVCMEKSNVLLLIPATQNLKDSFQIMSPQLFCTQKD